MITKASPSTRCGRLLCPESYERCFRVLERLWVGCRGEGALRLKATNAVSHIRIQTVTWVASQLIPHLTGGCTTKHCLELPDRMLKALLPKGTGWDVAPTGKGRQVGPEPNPELGLNPCGGDW